MRTLRPRILPLCLAATLIAAAPRLVAQSGVEATVPVTAAPAVEAPVQDASVDTSGQPKDTLLFLDGDLLTGELSRIEDGYAVFNSSKFGQVRVDFGHVKDLKCPRNFAVFRKGVKVRKANAVIGRFELKDGKIVVIPPSGDTITMEYADIAYAVDDLTFEQEISRKRNIHEGWSYEAQAGVSLVRATENGTAINAAGTLTRTLPGVDFLPRRNSSNLNVTDTYERVRQPAFDPEQPAVIAETHTFHASAEHNEYLHSKFYVLGEWSFDRNYAQGLLAEQSWGGGVGWSALSSFDNTLDIKTDFHHESQQFTENYQNDVLLGQKIVIEYERSLPKGMRFRESADYSPAYNEPHRYQANGTATLTLPIVWRIGLAFTVTDNYLNNPVPGFRRNTFRFATNLTFR